jgi:hypothetical protein
VTDKEVCRFCGAPKDPTRNERICRPCFNRIRREEYHKGGPGNTKREKLADTYARLHVRELVDLTKGAA